MQVRYNVVEREAEKELIPYAEANNMSVLAWSPLAKGAILGKYTLEEAAKLSDVRSGDPLFHPDNYRQLLELAKVIKGVADKYGKTPAQVALNWLIMASDTVIPIPGAKNAEQVKDNAGAMGWRLSYEDWRLIDEASKSIKITYVTW